MKCSWMVLGAVFVVATVPQALLAQSSDGETVYKETCKSCHGINGVPPEREAKKYKKLKALGDSGFVVNLSQDSIVTILQKGIDKSMKSFKDKLTEPEMHLVAAYIKELAEKRKAGA
jgi:mono/diheme cytochrome c family protein